MEENEITMDDLMGLMQIQQRPPEIFFSAAEVEEVKARLSAFQMFGTPLGFTKRQGFLAFCLQTGCLKPGAE